MKATLSSITLLLLLILARTEIAQARSLPIRVIRIESQPNIALFSQSHEIVLARPNTIEMPPSKRIGGFSTVSHLPPKGLTTASTFEPIMHRQIRCQHWLSYPCNLEVVFLSLSLILLFVAFVLPLRTQAEDSERDGDGELGFRDEKEDGRFGTGTSA